MHDGMTNITKLDSGQRKKFLRRVNRLIKAHDRVRRAYHGHPLLRDVVPEEEAVVAWSTVTLSYSGIEQAIKCLLQMRDKYIDEPPRKGGDRHHCIGKLFKKLSEDEKHVLRISFGIYRSLHDYIPVETVDAFLEAIDGNGDETGYGAWRYFLLEGDDAEKWPPKTHLGAMIEVWAALTDIIQARQFTNHGLETVKYRIVERIRDINGEIFRRVHKGNLDDVNEMLAWERRNPKLDINAYADLLHGFGMGEPLSLDAWMVSLPRVLTTSNALSTFVELAEQDVTDHDFAHFVRRAKSDGIAWNPSKNRFESTKGSEPALKIEADPRAESLFDPDATW